jgi:hypothetical protein
MLKTIIYQTHDKSTYAAKFEKYKKIQTKKHTFATIPLYADNDSAKGKESIKQPPAKNINFRKKHKEDTNAVYP